MNEKDLFTALRARKMPNGQRTWRCPDEAQLAAYADAQLEGQNRQRVEAHVADCDFCLSQVAFLLRLQGAEMPSEVPEGLLLQARELPTSKEWATARPTWRWASIAAATACLALTATLWLRSPDVVVTPSEPLRVPPAEISSPATSAPPAPSVVPRTVRNGQKKTFLPELVFPREGSILAREEVQFRWREVQPSLFYEVRVVTAEGDLVWEGRTDATHAQLPDSVQLQPGQKYFVLVRAYLPEGKTIQFKAVAFRTASHG